MVTVCKLVRRVRQEKVIYYVVLVEARGIRRLLEAQASVLGGKMELVANGELKHQKHRGKQYVSRLLAMARQTRFFRWMRGSKLMGGGGRRGLDRSCTFGDWREEDQGAPKEANGADYSLD